jgi:transketolase
VLPEGLRERLEPVMVARRQVREAWEARCRAWESAQPDAARELAALLRGETPREALADLPTFSAGTALATRVASRHVLKALIPRHGGLIGGSADLAESNGTNLEGEPAQGAARPDGRVLHFGVREHGMAGIANGLALHGGLRPYVATFLVFSDFMRGCVRLAALMGLPVTYVFTHDSILLGEDGPTHQPIEHIMSLRMIPGLHVVRPADAKETVGAWRHALSRGLGDGPTALVLTRQSLPVLEETRDDVSRGAYVLWQPAGDVRPDALVIATGSEVDLALRAARELERTHGKRVRVVSMPCWEAFAAQERAYRDEVLPPGVPSLALEAGVTLGWERWSTHVHGIDRFGASAPAADLAVAYGMTQDVVVARLLELA